MRKSIKTGVSFGLTSGVITTLGLIVGLNAGTHSQATVVGGILTIAIADAFSDALGIHISEESQDAHSSRSIWESTVATFLSKLLFALTFLIPILLFKLSVAIPVSVIWGLSVMSFFNYYIARQQKKNPWGPVLEHLIIGLSVVFITNYVGSLIAVYFS